MLVLLISAFFCVLSVSSFAKSNKGFDDPLADSPAVLVDEQQDVIEIDSRHVVYGVTDNTQLDIKDILNGALKMRTPNSDSLNLGLIKHDLWLKFELQTGAAKHKFSRILFLQPVIPYDITFYTVDESGAIEVSDLGFNQHMFSRDAPGVDYLLPLSFEANQKKTIYVRLKANGIGVAFTLRVYKSTAYIKDQIIDNFFVGILFGIIVAMIFYNLFMFFSIREKAYLYQAAFATSLSVICLALSGYGAYFVWPNHLDYNIHLVGYGVVFSAIFGILFTLNYTRRTSLFTATQKYLWLLLALGVVVFFMMLFLDELMVIPILLYACTVSPIILIIAYVGWRRKVSLAGFYLVSASIFLLAVVCFCLMLVNVLPTNIWFRYVILIGGAIEVMLLTLGLADVINLELKDKHKAALKQQETMLQLERTEADMVYQAFHSDLGLPNRILMRRSFEDIIADKHKYFSLLVFGISGFLQIQRTIGVTASKHLLADLVIKLRELLGDEEFILVDEKDRDFVADIGSSTFAFFVKAENQAAVEDIAKKVVKQLPKVLMSNDLSINIDLRSGVAQYPDDSRSFDDLLSFAQIALEYAENNHQQMTFYSENINFYQERRLTMLGDLRTAINDDKLLLYVQPKVSLVDGSVVGGEVLLRWKHEEYGFVPPTEFIAAAEKTGLIFSLTYWVMAKALSFISEIEDKDLDLAIAVNISARCIMDAKFQKRSMKVMRQEGFPVKKLIMEITETAFMDKAMQTSGVMKAFSDEGTIYSLDDFGTGYSSLSYLKQLPVSEIKIDQSFVRELSISENDKEIVQTMIKMGHNLGLKVVAEGVEDLLALKMLRNLDCDVAQGFYIARPMPLEDFFRWLEAYNPDDLSLDFDKPAT